MIEYLIMYVSLTLYFSAMCVFMYFVDKKRYFLNLITLDKTGVLVLFSVITWPVFCPPILLLNIAHMYREIKEGGE